MDPKEINIDLTDVVTAAHHQVLDKMLAAAEDDIADLEEKTIKDMSDILSENYKRLLYEKLSEKMSERTGITEDDLNQFIFR